MVHSFKGILIPNAITKSFISGKRNYYVHPFRFYFFCLIAGFGLLALNTRHLDVGKNESDLVGKYEQYAMMDTLQLSNKSECEKIILDSLRNQTPQNIKNLAKDTFVDFLIMGTEFKDYGINAYDAFTLTEKEINEKYSITSRMDQFIIHQFIRMQRDQIGTVKSIIANMLWGILLLTILMAGLLKILYVRHDSYFIEHLLHISNFHSLGLLLISILLLMNLIFNLADPEYYIKFIILGAIAYLFTCLKRYYNQGFWVTLIKMGVLGIGYILGIAIIIVIISIFTLLIL